MKSINRISLMVMAAGMFCFTACTEQAKHNQNTDTTATATVTDKAYVCPMNCEGSASDEAGQCPVCGMDLVKNTAYSAPVSASADTSQTGTVTEIK